LIGEKKDLRCRGNNTYQDQKGVRKLSYGARVISETRERGGIKKRGKPEKKKDRSFKTWPDTIDEKNLRDETQEVERCSGKNT